MRSTRFISCLAMAAALVAFAVVPASADAPTISATPHKKLADGQQVSVSASGFAADTDMAVVECSTSTVSPDACDLNTVAFVQTDDSGAYSDFPFTVSRILSDGTDCALNGGCYIGTQDVEAAGATAATLIKFDPNIPPLPPLEITVRIDKTPTVNDKGVVALKGTLKCTNRGSDDVEIDLDLRQVFNRAIFESFGGVITSCAADTTVPFRATMRPQNGLFGPGAAVVRMQAFAGNIFVARRVAVDLQAKDPSAARRASKPTLSWE